MICVYEDITKWFAAHAAADAVQLFRSNETNSLLLPYSSAGKIGKKKNKHTESIAKAIQVPHRPQQIEICNHYFGALFNKKTARIALSITVIVFLFHYLMFQT